MCGRGNRLSPSPDTRVCPAASVRAPTPQAQALGGRGSGLFLALRGTQGISPPLPSFLGILLQASHTLEPQEPTLPSHAVGGPSLLWIPALDWSLRSSPCWLRVTSTHVCCVPPKLLGQLSA